MNRWKTPLAIVILGAIALLFSLGVGESLSSRLGGDSFVLLTLAIFLVWFPACLGMYFANAKRASRPLLTAALLALLGPIGLLYYLRYRSRLFSSP